MGIRAREPGRLAPTVADIRNAVRACIADLPPGAVVLVACSGGADSLALAAALAFVAPREGLRAGAVTVDHGLQEGSADRAAAVAAALADLGLDPVRSVAVTVGDAGGPEAAARDARYAAIARVADEAGAVAVLLGHTLDDQAETVLLGLARGSGTRSLAGMPPRRGVYRRPLLGIRRAATAAACAAQALDPWHDPHNDDRRFARVRVRLDALPALDAALGPGVAEALARTATQLRADADLLDALTAHSMTTHDITPYTTTNHGISPHSMTNHDITAEQCAAGLPTGPQPLTAAALAELPDAIRSRVLRSAALAAGCPPGALTSAHVRRVDELITRWHGQRWVDLPGGVRAARREGEVLFTGGVADGRQ